MNVFAAIQLQKEIMVRGIHILHELGYFSEADVRQFLYLLEVKEKSRSQKDINTERSHDRKRMQQSREKRF